MYSSLSFHPVLNPKRCTVHPAKYLVLENKKPALSKSYHNTIHTKTTSIERMTTTNCKYCWYYIKQKIIIQEIKTRNSALELWISWVPFYFLTRILTIINITHNTKHINGKTRSRRLCQNNYTRNSKSLYRLNADNRPGARYHLCRNSILHSRDLDDCHYLRDPSDASCCFAGSPLRSIRVVISVVFFTSNIYTAQPPRTTFVQDALTLDYTSRWSPFAFVGRVYVLEFEKSPLRDWREVFRNTFCA